MMGKKIRSVFSFCRRVGSENKKAIYVIPSPIQGPNVFPVKVAELLFLLSLQNWYFSFQKLYYTFILIIPSLHLELSSIRIRGKRDMGTFIKFTKFYYIP